MCVLSSVSILLCVLLWATPICNSLPSSGATADGVWTAEDEALARARNLAKVEDETTSSYQFSASPSLSSTSSTIHVSRLMNKTEEFLGSESGCRSCHLVHGYEASESRSTRSTSSTHYDEIEDETIFEGDMILDKDQIKFLQGVPFGCRTIFYEQCSAKNVCSYIGRQECNIGNNPNYLWPNNVVYYSFDETVANSRKDKVRSVLGRLQEKLSSCLTFQEKNEGNRIIVGTSGKYKDTKTIKGCWSEVGFKGYFNRPNKLNLEVSKSECWNDGTIEHEFLHAIGVYHTQSRSDRDDYVTIHFENVKKGKKNNFIKHGKKTISHHDLPYDYSSVMHYPADAFSKEYGQITIEAKDPTKQKYIVGQRQGVSACDVELIRRAYGCSSDVSCGIHRAVRCSQCGYGASRCQGDCTWTGEECIYECVRPDLPSQESVDCSLSHWSRWSVCSKSCGRGVQTRERKILQEAANGGRECSRQRRQEQPCSRQSCPPTEKPACLGGSDQYDCCTEENPCMEGQGDCDKDSECQGSLVCDDDSDNCKNFHPNAASYAADCCTKPVPAVVSVDCSLSGWSRWSVCSKSCGGGVRTRERKIHQEAANGGRECSTARRQRQQCSRQSCRPTIRPGNSKEVCGCINPFAGTKNHYRGVPANLCSKSGPRACYVKCNGGCRDQKQTANAFRCSSKQACAVLHGEILSDAV